MAEYNGLFKFAAKAGALEGYLYGREKLDPLDNWVNNIDCMYRELPYGVKQDIKEEVSTVLKRILANGENSLGSDIKARLNKLLGEL